MRTRTHTLTAATLLLLTAALAGCSSSGHPAAPTPTGTAACRAAIKAQYIPHTVTLKGEPTRPPECAGLTSDEVSRIAESVIDENTQ